MATIEFEYLYATDCQIATYTGLVDRKRSPKHEITRARSIAIRMLGVCSTLDLENVPGAHRQTRVIEILKRAKGSAGASTEGYGDIASALDDYVTNPIPSSPRPPGA